MGPDLTSKRWIVAKGILFALLAALSGALIVWVDFPTLHRALLLGICVWAACRFYYFLFHVLHAYVDPTLPSAGVMDLVKHLIKKWRG
ncbi:hypothetical protein OKA05_05465 [Luteolibacter arcticus]|uniref:Uncharacterized protein n=1 Tax=Luteolibacter arcticus TaxID=1581411 RepID=A0ABT3GEE2_9BACT|nr:hypothetical protein [Luteolibacter arcticus]MCW1921990.1 hypothetical protein [Luteolibacter arcticus]